MNRTGNHGGRSDRLKRALMTGCALILFVLGVWLLIAPVQAHGENLIDNVVANNSCTMPERSAGVRR